MMAPGGKSAADTAEMRKTEAEQPEAQQRRGVAAGKGEGRNCGKTAERMRKTRNLPSLSPSIPTAGPDLGGVAAPGGQPADLAGVADGPASSPCASLAGPVHAVATADNPGCDAGQVAGVVAVSDEAAPFLVPETLKARKRGAKDAPPTPASAADLQTPAPCQMRTTMAVHELAVIDAATAIVQAATDAAGAGSASAAGVTFQMRGHELAVIAAALAIVKSMQWPTDTAPAMPDVAASAVVTPAAMPKRVSRSFEGWENSRHPVAWPPGYSSWVARCGALGIKRRDGYRSDVFRGSRAALVAVGMVSPDQFPGEPGRGKSMVSFYPDGTAKRKGSDGYTALQIFRRGVDRFDVHVTTPQSVNEARYAAGCVEDEACRAKLREDHIEPDTSAAIWQAFRGPGHDG